MPFLKIILLALAYPLLFGCAPVPATPPAAQVPVHTGTGTIGPLPDLDDFVLIKGGSFIMGDIYGSDQYAKPAHKVTVDDFFMAKYELTFAEYDRFCDNTGRPRPDDKGWGRGNRPVINITHTDALAYTRWLSAQMGKSIRLPSEAEWEYAARASKSTNFWWGDALGNGNANCRSCGSRWDKQSTAPVGSFQPNPNGLYDMHGNVYEWVSDSFFENYLNAPADGSARIVSGAYMFISRGGSWWEIESSLFSFSRNWSNGDEPRADIGMRLVMDP